MKKKTLLLLFIVTLALNLKAQRLTLDDLITVQKADLAGLTSFLGSKGWEFNSSTLPTAHNYGEISFVHSKQEFEEKASAWLHFLYSDSLATRVVYQTASREVLQSFKQKIAAYGMEQASQSVAEGAISTSYTGKNYAVVVTHTITNDYNQPVYLFTLYDKTDYLLDRLLRKLKE